MVPKATLINWTPKPIETMAYVRRIMHSPVPNSLEEFMKNPEKWLGMSADDYVTNVLLKDGMPTFLEFVHMTFKLENVSRSLTHQIVRHRIGTSFSQQSLRCVKLPTFADDNTYYLPDTVKDTKVYEQAMRGVQALYKNLLRFGVSTEDARGVLPMGIGTTIIVGCNMRSLMGIINKRLCLKTQEEFRKVAEQMIKQIEEKMDVRLLNWFGKPCDFSKCIMESECLQQLRENKRTGAQQTEYVCPIYLAKFVKEEND